MRTYEETLALVIATIAPHAPSKTVGAHDHIQHDLGLDSLATMEVIADLEEALGMTIPNEVVARVATPDDVARALVKLG